MTVSERKNATILIKYTTVRPFTFMGSCFKCFFCKEYYSDVTDLLRHTSTHECECKDQDVILEKYLPKGKKSLQVDISELKCRVCREKFDNLSTVQNHLRSVHKIEFYSNSNGMTEYDMELRDGKFFCLICSEGFHAFSMLNSHLSCHFVKVVCETCGVGFMNQRLLMKHKEMHTTNALKCNSCDRCFAKKSQLKYHTEIFHKEKPGRMKKCPRCPQSFKEHYSKMAHLKKAHGVNKSFKCHICSEIFNSRRTVTQHTTRYHTEKYKCELCFKCFSIESKLKQHMRGHLGERNFICHICKNAYMHKMTLSKHMRCHSTANTYKFVCSECGAGFHSKSEFLKHSKQSHVNFK